MFPSVPRARTVSAAKVLGTLMAPGIRLTEFSCVGKCTKTRKAGFLGLSSWAEVRYLRTTARRKKRRLAGRSAMRRIRYGYQADPYGT